MRRRSVVVIASVLAVSAAGAVGFLRREQRAVESRELALPALGQEAVLHVTWHEKSSARLAAASQEGGGTGLIEGQLDLEADLVLARETTTNGTDAVRAELRDVRTSRVALQGQDLAAGPEGAKLLEGKAVHLVVEDGHIARVLVDKDAPSVAVQLTEGAARRVLVEPPKPGAFERDEDTTAGKLHVKYAPKGPSLSRTVVSAVALEGLPDRCEAPCVQTARGEGEVRFEEGTVVAFLSDRTELRAGAPGGPTMYESSGTFEATRVRSGAWAGPAVDTSGLASKALGEPFESAADHRAALARRATGMTIDDVLGGLAALASEGTAALPKGWVVQASALLELEPKLIAEVAIRFEDDQLPTAGRLAILDLLAATGGDEAKAALMKVLDGPAAREDESRLAFVQRLMLVEEPNLTMARGVRERLASSQARNDADMAYAEAHVLGAIAGNLAARGERREAKAAIETLARAVDSSTTPTSRAAYVAALGNAGDRTQVARIAKHADDGDQGVRRAVASALRKTKDPAARATLVKLAVDADTDVQVTAVDSLAEHGVGPAEQKELTGLLDGGHMGPEAESHLVSVLLQNGAPTPELRASLEHVLARTEDPRTAARVRLALAMAEAPH